MYCSVRSSWLKKAFLGIVSVSTLLACTSAALVAGWYWSLPPNLVTIYSGKRSHVFYEGEQVRFSLYYLPCGACAPQPSAAVRYEVRDYYGELVDEGPAGVLVDINVTEPGWYKLYLYGASVQEPWGEIVGGTTFCIFRNDPNFPPLPSSSVSTGSHPSYDQPMRGVTGMGVQRLIAPNPTDIAGTIVSLNQDVTLDEQFYLPYDPYRDRQELVMFTKGTTNIDAVRQIVEYFRDRVRNWSPRNEPNFGSNGTNFVPNELIPFYNTVKSVSPDLNVVAPTIVTINPMPDGLFWIEDFLKAGGANYVDGISFQANNAINGDLWLGRTALGALKDVLNKYGAGDKKLWQLEQGAFAAVYGAYQPRLQGRRQMLQTMVYEQLGVPKERNYYFYNRSHGYWDFPSWWINDDGSLNPAGPLMRVWSEEVYGTRFKEAYDFGALGNNLYIGSLFEGPGKRMAAFQSAGSPDGEVELLVTGTDSLLVTKPMGGQFTLDVVDGKAILPVSELPSYVRLPEGVDISVAQIDPRPNLARLPGVSATASGTGVHPINSSIPNSITKLYNGKLENWYYTQQSSEHPWMDNTPSFPAWVVINLPSPKEIDTVIVYACPPWQWMGTLIDYELQYDSAGEWVTLEHVQEPTKTFISYTPPVRTNVDSFFSDRWIFQHRFEPVTTSKIRLLVHQASYGGGATKDIPDAGGQALGISRINLREIEIYNSADSGVAISGVNKLISDEPIEGVTMRLSGSETRNIPAGADGRYNADKLLAGGNYKIRPWKYRWQFSPRQKDYNPLSADQTFDFVGQPYAPSENQNGLTGDYFTGTSTLTNWQFVQIDPVVNFQWSPTSGPDPITGGSDYSIRWTGQVKPLYSELYRFHTLSDDGVRLWVDGKLIINNWTNHGTTEDIGTIQLEADRRYDIKLEYYQGGGGAEIRLLWSSNSQPRQVIPTTRLFPVMSRPKTKLNEVKSLANEVQVRLSDMVVSNILPDAIYIQTPDRASGIRVSRNRIGGFVKDLCEITYLEGTMKTNSNGERFIDATAVECGGPVDPVPLTMNNQTLGGADQGYDSVTGAGQRGVTGRTGLNNIGLLVSTSGVILEKEAVTYPTWFTISDGSSVPVRVRVTPGTTIPATGSMVKVTGSSSCYVSNGDLLPQILLRGQAELQVLAP